MPGKDQPIPWNLMHMPFPHYVAPIEISPRLLYDEMAICEFNLGFSILQSLN